MLWNVLLGPIEQRILLGRIFGLLSMIDEVFSLIHPRTVQYEITSAPKWLREARDERTMTGVYIGSEHDILIPRGPLLRLPREENFACADSMADRYSYLSVVPKSTSEDRRKISVTVKIVSNDVFGGASSPAKVGSEEVLFVPIAEKVGDLLLSIDTAPDGQIKFYDTVLLDEISPAEKIISERDEEPGLDIVFAPELVISEIHADELSEKLGSVGATSPRILVAGSGATKDVDENNQLAWNEARIMNGFGVELWRQRKIWPAGLQPRHVEQYELSDPQQSLTLERNASGNELVISDLDGFGRCLVLICQDIQALPLSEEIIKNFQPDWIFVPILDQGASYESWAHQRAFELSAHSQARFLISCSRALKPRPMADDLGHGLAIGPKSSIEPDDLRRACKLAKPTTKPSSARISWSKFDWKKTKFSTE